MVLYRNSSTFIKIIDSIDTSSYCQFNWFKVMYKMTEEKNLHSRMISFLLNPQGSHVQGTLFLELFFEEFGITNFDLNGVEVLPNEHDKREEDNIDILITNANKQAIIIENKIFANDSNKGNVMEQENGRCTHKYQIPRYYYKIQCKGYTVTHIFYLTVKHNKPSFFDEFPVEVKQLVQFKDYIQSILNWIDKCLAVYPKEDIFKVGLQQYKQATTEFLNDMQLALKLKQITADHLQEAFEFWPKKQIDESDKYFIIKSQFIHVKWHTVHEFYAELRNRIQDTFNVEVSEIDNEEITKLTHIDQIKINKTDIRLHFNYQGTIYYICNDAKGFSVGRHVEPKTAEDFSVLNETVIYSYFDFTQEKVFELIKPEKTNELVEQIVNQLKDFINK